MKIQGFITKADYVKKDNEDHERIELHIEDTGPDMDQSDDWILAVWNAAHGSTLYFTQRDAEELVEAMQIIIDRHAQAVTVTEAPHA